VIDRHLAEQPARERPILAHGHAVSLRLGANMQRHGIGALGDNSR
jgi:hypothetical protein